MIKLQFFCAAGSYGSGFGAAGYGLGYGAANLNLGYGGAGYGIGGGYGGAGIGEYGYKSFNKLLRVLDR